MRAVYVLTALLVAYLLGGYVDHTYDWPFGLLDPPSVLSRGGSTVSSVPLPNIGRLQGTQDPSRTGAMSDFQRCMVTMMQRREPEQEARIVCEKIVAGISGR